MIFFGSLVINFGVMVWLVFTQSGRDYANKEVVEIAWESVPGIFIFDFFECLAERAEDFWTRAKRLWSTDNPGASAQAESYGELVPFVTMKGEEFLCTLFQVLSLLLWISYDFIFM